MLTLREFTSPDRLAHLSGACARGIAFRRVLVSATHKQRLASSRLNSFSFHLAFSNAISLSHRHLQKSLCAVPRCARLYWDSLTNIPACYSAMPQHCSGQRGQRAVIRRLGVRKAQTSRYTCAFPVHNTYPYTRSLSADRLRIKIKCIY